MKKFLWTILFIQICLSLSYNKEYTFIADPLLKAIQGVSLVDHKIEEIYYPGKELDPNYSLFVFDGTFSREVGQKYIGQYPIAFSFIAGFLLKLPLVSISIFSLFLLGCSIFFLNRVTYFGYFFLILYFSSSIINNSYFDLNETGPFFFLNALGFGFFISYFKTEKYRDILFGLFFVATATWFRLESILFGFSITLASFVVLPKQRILKMLPTILIASFPVLLFFLFNHFHYGHYLGPRYFFNFSEDTTFGQRILRMISMSLLYFDKTGLKLGLFFVMPVLGLAIYFCFKNRNQLSKLELFSLYVFCLQFIFISFSAPNDGITFTSRYHILEILPGLVLVNFLVRNFSNQKIVNALFSFSLLCQLVFSIGFIFFFSGNQKVSIFC